MSIHFNDHNATFIHIPRTGGTSFKHWSIDNIKNIKTLIDPNHSGRLLHVDINQLANIWGDLGTTFTFVRNPFARLVSIFHYVGQNTEARIKDRSKGIYGISANSISLEDDIKILGLYRKGFTNWLTESRTSNNALENFYRQKQTQMFWLSGIKPDLYIKTEELNTQFFKIQKLLNCDVPLIHINKSDHNPYREYYNSDTRKLVETMFREDLEMFDYEF